VTRLQPLAQTAAVIGAVGAVALTLYAGRNNGLPLLMILMSGWVFAPFFGYAVIRKIAGRRSSFPLASLDGVVIVMAVVALAIYAQNVVHLPTSKPAAVFVAVPIASWVVMLIVVVIASFIARREVPRQ
jgi:uncharacterized membrane protein